MGEAAKSERKKLVAFLEDAARYFERRDTKGEDAAFWANKVNAENCRAAAVMLVSDGDPK